MINNYLYAQKELKPRYFSILKYAAKHSIKISSKVESFINYRWTLTLLFILSITFSSHSQKRKNRDIEPVIYCVKEIGNGLYQASFGYTNPTKKEVIIDENGSIIKSNKGKKVAKGLNKFKPGSVDRAFTKEFGSNDYVEWTIISNGKTHTVIANANSAKKCVPDDGFIFPVIGNGKSFDIIGQELTSLCDGVIGETPSEFIFQTSGDKVLIEIIPKEGARNAVINLLKGAPFLVPDTDFLLFETNVYDDLDGLSAIDVFVSQDEPCILNNYPDIINFARPVYPAYNNSGGVVSQGDAAQTTNIVRESFRMVNSEGDIVPLDGRDISIGVLSDSYDRAIPGVSLADLDVENNELPPQIEVLKDNDQKSLDEGRAMMQIIHDVAPGAKLKFHTATSSPRQFEVGFKSLFDCDIIVDDITFITEPFFLTTGRISQAIKSFVSSPGKFHFTSAGNLANKGYQSTFSTSSSLPTTNFIPSGSPTRAHVFGSNPDDPEDYLQKISVVPGTYLIALQWKEDLASQINSLGAGDDLDIYIVDDAGRLLVGSNRVNIAGDPTEIIVFRSTGTGTANILITSANGTTGVPFRYIAFKTTAGDGTPNGLKFEEYFNNGAPTVSGHAMTPESITVGAVDYRKAAQPIAESFSSYGGTLSDGVTELFVDLYAPDGGNTTSTTIGQFANCDTCDKDEFRNFYGTSASAPHLAGAMALLMSAAPSWFPPTQSALANDETLRTSYSASDAFTLFQETSEKFNAPDGSGSAGGLINTLRAFKSIATQTARITELRVEDGITPSAEPFTLTIIGEFFPETVEDITVLFGGEPLNDVQIVEEDNTIVIKATVPAFSGNPELIVVSAAKTPGGGDEGKSDPVYILDEGKLALNIIPNNTEIEYGQDISLTYNVEGLPEGTDMSLTFPEILEILGLPEVQLNSGADLKLEAGDFPIVFDYVITPSFGGLDYDHDLFQINFISGYNDEDLGKVGYLTINKKNLTIGTEERIIVTYGDAIEVPLIYGFDETGISNTSLFYSLISENHSGDFFTDATNNRFNAVVNRFNAVVNGYDLLQLLDGGSWIASERTILNRFNAVVNGMSIIPLDIDHFTDYVEEINNSTTNRFNAVVNRFNAVVNGEDLFNNQVDLTIENRFNAVVNSSTLGGEDDGNDYQSVFAIIDLEDVSPEDNPDEDRSISKVYALNMITGLNVTAESENHYVYPGAFLNAMAANFNITYEPGSITMLPRNLTVSTENIQISYGDSITKQQLLEKTNFDGWAFEGAFMESISTYFSDEEVPFEFEKDGVIYQLGELTELGDYKITLKDIDNYNIQHTVNESFGTLSLSAAILSVEIEDLVINLGETPVFSSTISGFVTGENKESVFEGGIPYYLEDEFGNEQSFDESGVYTIRIRNPENYLIQYTVEGRLFVNGKGRRKIRTYADCVSFDPQAEDGLNYSVIFRYENENNNTKYVLEGSKNYLDGGARFEGILPTVYLPGTGTFKIRFDGNVLTWNLETFGSFHKTSVSSANNDGTGECEAKINVDYVVYPNPVSEHLFVEQNVSETSTVYVLNMFGILMERKEFTEGGNMILSFDVFDYESGLYIVRIVSEHEVKTFNIIKE